jgi:tetratricopeptide (TPR) repeat protein
MTRLASALAIALIALGSSIAFAQSDADEDFLAGGADDEAHALFAAGEVAYREGRYENALHYFRQAYDLSHRPVLLYNIGAAADRLRRDDETIAAFEQYLAEIPDASNRGEVEARLSVLRRARDEAARVEPPPIETEAHETVPPPVRSEGPGPWPWVTLGAGAAVAIVGAILLGLAVADVSTVENAPLHSTWAAVEGAYDRAEPMSIAGATLLGLGGAVMIGGLVWGIAGGGGASEQRMTLRVLPGGLSLEGSF